MLAMLFLFLSFSNVKGDLWITGPTTVCSGQNYTYTAHTSGILIKCDYTWSVVRVHPSGYIEVLRTGDVNADTWTYPAGTEELGIVHVQCTLSYGTLGCATSTTTRYQITNGPPPIFTTAPTSMAYNSTETFEAYYECDYNIQLRWTVPNGWLVNGVAGPIYTQNPVSITAPSSGCGLAPITVEAYYTPDEVYSLPKTVYVQLPTLSVYVTGPHSAYTWQTPVWTAHVSGGSGNYEYQWQYSLDGEEWFLGGSESTYEYVFSEGEAGIYLTVSATDGVSCGSGNYYCSCADCNSFFSAYPNPAQESITINNTKEKSFNVELINNRGESVKAFKNLNTTYNIATNDLPDGPYTLKIISRDGIITRKIWIKK